LQTFGDSFDKAAGRQHSAISLINLDEWTGLVSDLAVCGLLMAALGSNRCNLSLETPKRGQSAHCPDRLFMKAVNSLRQIFRE
jgi:hypothetical protein